VLMVETERAHGHAVRGAHAYRSGNRAHLSHLRAARRICSPRRRVQRAYLGRRRTLVAAQRMPDKWSASCSFMAERRAGRVDLKAQRLAFVSIYKGF